MSGGSYRPGVGGTDPLDDLPEQQRLLILELRRLRELSGLSLTALAAMTHYSKSSWGLWLAGERPVPPLAGCRTNSREPGDRSPPCDPTPRPRHPGTAAAAATQGGQLTILLHLPSLAARSREIGRADLGGTGATTGRPQHVNVR